MSTALFVVLEGVKGAAYDEIVEIVADGKEKKLGRIVEINEDKAVVQVFEGTDNLSLKNTHTRLTGHPMEIGLTDQLLGRTFNGIGAPDRQSWRSCSRKICRCKRKTVKSGIQRISP